MARKDEFFSVLLALALLTHVLQAQCVQDNRSSKTSGLMIAELTITGTQSLNSTELARLTRKLTGSCVDENQEELGERLRALFQDEGYFQAEVQNVHIKVNDPLALPKPVTVEVEVKEGRRFKVGGIKFVGNHVFSASDLRRHFALNKGDLFARNKIGNGLEGVRDLYVADGFMDWVAIPDTELSDGTVDLSVSVVEGRQYRMGKLEIFAKKEAVEQLRSQWEIAEGAVFDRTYVGKYIDKNRPLLPPGFNQTDVQVVRNCRDSSVEVRLPLDGTDPRSQSAPKDIDCEPSGTAGQSKEN